MSHRQEVCRICQAIVFSCRCPKGAHNVIKVTCTSCWERQAVTDDAISETNRRANAEVGPSLRGPTVFFAKQEGPREQAARELHDLVCDYCHNPEDYPGCYVRREALRLWNVAVSAERTAVVAYCTARTGVSMVRLMENIDEGVHLMKRPYQCQACGSAYDLEVMERCPDCSKHPHRQFSGCDHDCDTCDSVLFPDRTNSG